VEAVEEQEGRSSRRWWVCGVGWGWVAKERKKRGGRVCDVAMWWVVKKQEKKEANSNKSGKKKVPLVLGCETKRLVIGLTANSRKI
jgi:hypothetical protein